MKDSILDVEDVKAILEYMQRPNSPLRILWFDCWNERLL